MFFGAKMLHSFLKPIFYGDRIKGLKLRRSSSTPKGPQQKRNEPRVPRRSFTAVPQLRHVNWKKNTIHWVEAIGIFSGYLYPGALLLRRRGRRAPGYKYPEEIPCVPRHSSTAALGYLLWRPQLPAAVAGPFRVVLQLPSFYTFPF